MEQHKAKRIMLCLILLFFLSIKIFHLLTQKGISWDSAVYIGMGKYIFSGGNIGLWEPARPLVWPILLGLFWKIGLSPIISGRILELVLSVCCVYLIYLIGKDIFNENIALLSSFLLAFSPTFLFYSSGLLTGIPSTFLALLSVYFLVKNKYFLAGFFIALSFMARFLQLFVLIPIIFILFFYKEKRLKKIIRLSCGFSIILIPYLILNIFLYKNPSYPFLLQMFMSEYTGWIFHQPPSFYFISLFKENFLVLFAIIGTITILKQNDYRKIAILSIFLLFFIFFNSIAHKEMRFAIVFLPYMYLVSSYGLFNGINVIKKKKGLFCLAVIILGSVWLVQETSQIKTPNYKEYPEFTNYFKTNEIKDGIWISSPLFIACTNKKADELIYYPLYNSKKIDIMQKSLPNAKHILLNTCDILPCPPTDQTCYSKTNVLLDSIKKEFELIYYKKENKCEEFIFRR